VSCNPISFARDAKILTEGGYALTRVVPVDQFPWTGHLELVGVFAKARKR
jgi:23S rRNA (uracil1939-C5)-methyltransferase